MGSNAPAPLPVVFYRSSRRAVPSAESGCSRTAARVPGSSRRTRPPLSGFARPSRRERFTRRRGDLSQQVRLAVQVAFAAIAALVGIQFYLWVRYFETGGATARVSRPPGVEAWLPIAALMNLKTLLVTGTVPRVHGAGMFMLIAFLAIAFALRKSFCSWMCPVGTVSEWLWQGGEAAFGRNLPLPRWLDIALRSLKYVLLSLFLYVVVTMSVPDIRAFLSSPYGTVADVKMLDFFRHMGRATAITLSVLLLLSVAVKNVWCRFLCPYGAMLGLVALASPTRIRRDPDLCIDCAKCANACPAGLPVDTALSVRSAECTACMTCVAVCPAAGALELTCGTARHHARLSPWTVAAFVAVLFLGIVGYAQWRGYWDTDLPDETYFELVPNAASFAHPR
jgi:polyferredoxin